jgi:NADH-quinone oxidoreductase subunit K
MGQIFTLFIITIAAAETGLGLAIVLLLYRQRASADIAEQRELAEPVEAYAADELIPSPSSPAAAEELGAAR